LQPAALCAAAGTHMECTQSLPLLSSQPLLMAPLLYPTPPTVNSMAAAAASFCSPAEQAALTAVFKNAATAKSFCERLSVANGQ